ncbi:MAG: methionyl-tRNA formyltransferase [Acutalibacteraceae bacterium]|nr:methionyl-tRNA formyltransferase [Acutalibacteraceae bacterium]
MKLVFMGTPDYAVNTLEALISAGHNVAAVFAQPDKPVGRKHILTAPPVKVCAQNHGIAVYQPNTLRDGKATEVLKEIAPDVIVVVAYGKILPKEILDIPKYGCVNGHASLLPRYRGASPIQWCIVCGEKETGVTAMLMDEGMDTGDILKTVKTEIGPEETAEELFCRLSGLTAELLVNTLDELKKDNITPIKQDEGKASYAPIIKKEMAQLNFTDKTADEIHNAVRGYYSWPCTYFFLENKRVKVIKAAVSDNTNAKAGTVIKSDDSLVIACKDGTAVELVTVQPEGSKPMTAKQMLCGRPIAQGTVIGCE